MSLARALLVSALLGAPVAHAQTAQSGGAPVSPATAAPRTEQQPNLRNDSEPNVSQTPRTDSGPLPETLGADATPYVELGPDWSLPARDNETSTLKRIVTSRKGMVSVQDVATRGVAPLPVTNPPVPVPVTITHIPQPPMVMLPKPPDPLAAVPQPTRPIAP